jgi:hypothetical protein
MNSLQSTVEFGYRPRTSFDGWAASVLALDQEG